METVNKTQDPKRKDVENEMFSIDLLQAALDL
jgi:hypothetical protein